MFYELGAVDHVRNAGMPIFALRTIVLNGIEETVELCRRRRWHVLNWSIREFWQLDL